MNEPMPVLNSSDEPQVRAILQKYKKGDLIRELSEDEVAAVRPFVIITTAENEIYLELSEVYRTGDGVKCRLKADELGSMPVVLETFRQFWLACGSTWEFNSEIRKKRHELRAPLNVILGFSESLQTDRGQSPESLSKLKAIYESGVQLLKNIDGLMGHQAKLPSSLPRSDSGISPLRKELVVLIVDDMASNRQLIAEYLSPLGFTLYQAAGGIQAMEVLEEVKADLVLLDYYMPGLTGAETALKIAALNLPRLPVLVGITSAAEGEEKEAFQEAGVAEILNKPMNQQDLMNCIQRVASWEAGQNPASLHLPAGIPAFWLDSVRESLEVGNITRLKKISEEALKWNTELGEFMTTCLARYDLKSINLLIGSKARE